MTWTLMWDHDWEPIETAPRNGLEVLVRRDDRRDDGELGHVFQVARNTQDSEGAWYFRSTSGRALIHRLQPTHWRLIPFARRSERFENALERLALSEIGAHQRIRIASAGQTFDLLSVTAGQVELLEALEAFAVTYASPERRAAYEAERDAWARLARGDVPETSDVPQDGGARQMDAAILEAELRGMRRGFEIARDHADPYPSCTGDACIVWERADAALASVIASLKEGATA